MALRYHSDECTCPDCCYARKHPQIPRQLTADTITDEQIRELRGEQMRTFRDLDPATCSDAELAAAAEPLDYTFAALRNRTIPGLFTGKRITPAEGRARCAEILNEREVKP